MNTYEAMFLLDAGTATEWSAVEAEINRLMTRADAKLLYCRKWDERRLAYEIDTAKRGLYVLTYFQAAPERISPLERDVQLSDEIIRALILRSSLADEDIAKMLEVDLQLERDRAERATRLRAEAAAPPPAEPQPEAAAATAVATPAVAPADVPASQPEAEAVAEPAAEPVAEPDSEETAS